MNANERIESLERQLREHGTQAFPLISTRQRIVRELALTQDDAELLLAWVAYWEEKASTSTADLVRTDRALQETRELVVSQQREILKLRGDVSDALIESGRTKADLAARVAELERLVDALNLEALYYFAADGSFVVMESREAVVAARIKAAKRMADLEREVADGERVVLDLRDQADRWQARANALLDALKKGWCRNCTYEKGYADHVVALLAAHPASSLAAYRASVLKEASSWVRSQQTAPHFTEQLRYTIADGIDALAAQAPEVRP